MLSASNVTSGDKALEIPSYGKPQTDVNVTFQNFLFLFLVLFPFFNLTIELSYSCVSTSPVFAGGVPRNEQM